MRKGLMGHNRWRLIKMGAIVDGQLLDGRWAGQLGSGKCAGRWVAARQLLDVRWAVVGWQMGSC